MTPYEIVMIPLHKKFIFVLILQRLARRGLY
jgi:hypothetical protein